MGDGTRVLERQARPTVGRDSINVQRYVTWNYIHTQDYVYVYYSSHEKYNWFDNFNYNVRTSMIGLLSWMDVV